jgi:hypothetical protein
MKCTAPVGFSPVRFEGQSVAAKKLLEKLVPKRHWEFSEMSITDPSQKLPAASDNVQNHTQVTEVVGLVSVPIRDNLISRADNWYCRCRTHIPQQVGVEDNSIPTPPHADKSLINRT